MWRIVATVKLIFALNLECDAYFRVENKLNLVYMFVFLADDTAHQPSGRDHKHHTKDFDDLPTKTQDKHGQIFAMEWTRRFGGT